MKQKFCKHFPLGSFKCMAMWPYMFIKKGATFTTTDINHEEIHGAQQKELLLVFFYLFYACAYLKEMVHCLIDKQRGQAPAIYIPRNYWHRIMHAVIFEREAYAMQDDGFYLSRRKFWSWLKY